MRNILKIGFAALASALVFAACDPQDDKDFSLGSLPDASQLSFTATPSASNANIIDFKNTSPVAGVATWEFGNGSSAKGETAQSSYPYKGTYSVTMTLYTDGGSVSKTQDVEIVNDNFTLLDTPLYNMLTGGASSPEGRTWVFQQFYDGHFGVGPADGDGPSWWSCPAEGKDGSSLYTQEFTFILDGTQFKWENNGYIYTNAAGKSALGIAYFIDNPNGVGDFDVAYVPQSNLTFSINETAKTITLSNDAFLGHYAGTSTYSIVSYTDTTLYLKCASSVESGNGWWYKLTLKDKNTKPTVVVKLKATPLLEDFESEEASVEFTAGNMGLLTSRYYSNPAPIGANLSGKVFLYEKSSDYYSNLSFTASDYKFNLTEQNKIKLSVYIPSYNDYTTDNEVAGDWITNKKLSAQVAVKLQNNSLGDNAYTTQTEIVKSNLETDKWIDLVFDFSSVSDREDFDKIVIQFGGEGHSGTGIFFMDNFEFLK